ncbi:hypothetical protein [Pimelobacter simplex]|uniref:hypothetical protein n=1 Tax=Nocardioides simplex TaxID=2045 RepID=UPI00214FDD79|nr:hypothetical protein [Pimelobacter simplex]UUW89436.1 hypothetical protein M0M43_27460 [Pimelobacter simplex]UUW93265.1 hypothetical protein M0M48_16115 [Pimelobacter simplex]
MRISRGVRRLLMGVLATSAVALALAVAPAPAAHATGYTPIGGPGINLIGSSIAFTAIEAYQKFTCSTANYGGTVVSPGAPRAYGSPAATLTTQTISGCSNPTMGAVTFTPIGSWDLAFTGPPAAGGTVSWPVRVSNVAIAFSYPSCTFRIEGAINGRFNTATQRFTPNTGASGLAIPASGPGVPTGVWCTVLDLQPGDTFEVAGSWTNGPPSGSTGLTAAAGYTASGTSLALTGTNVSLHDLPANQHLTTCPTFTLDGTVDASGAPRTYGTAAATLPSIAASGCTGSATLAPAGTWALVATGAPDATGQLWPARVTNVTLALDRPGWCSFTVAGSVNGTFDETTQRFTPVAGATGLSIVDVPAGPMCATLGIASGHPVGVGGFWTSTGPALDLS